jgi:hypothetical protein
MAARGLLGAVEGAKPGGSEPLGASRGRGQPQGERDGGELHLCGAASGRGRTGAFWAARFDLRRCLSAFATVAAYALDV